MRKLCLILSVDTSFKSTLLHIFTLNFSCISAVNTAQDHVTNDCMTDNQSQCAQFSVVSLKIHLTAFIAPLRHLV